MFAVGRLGSYISKGVYTVSGPFHPFGGAVDIVVVEQPDGTFRSSPWYVRFGKFQGVLKATENFVRINVNGVDADFHMYLDHKGEAFFLREVEAVEGESEHYASSGDESDVNADLWKAQKSRSYNFDANRSDLVSKLESDNGKALARNNSRRGRLFGLSFGRRSMKENGFRGEEGDPGVDRVSSMERAEIAADLLEVRWTTNLRVGPPKLPPSKSAVNEAHSNGVADDGLKRDVCDAKLSQKTNDFETEGSASYSEEYSHSENRWQGGSVSVNDGGLSCTSDRPVAGKFGTSANDKLVEGASVKSMVHEDVSSGIVSINELLSDNYSDRIDPSLSRFSDKGKPSAEVHKAPLSLDVEECLRDSALERNGNLTLLNDSEDEQFSFSDLDVQKVDKNADQNVQIESSSPDSKECLLQDSCESSEDEVTETKCSDDKSNQFTNKFKQVDIDHPSPKESSNSLTSPINITKLHKDIDEQALTSIAESMPNMLSDGDGLSSNGAPHLLGHSLDSNLEAIKIVKDALAGSECNTPQQQVDNVRLKTDSYQISEDIKTIISDPAVEVSLCRHLLYEGMGYEAAAVAFDAEKLDIDEFSSLGHEIVKNDKLVVRIGGLYFPWDAALPIASAIGSQEQEQMLEPMGMIAVGQVDNKTSEGVTQKSLSSRSGSWKLWPFSFKRSNSIQGKCIDSEPASSESRSVKGDSMDGVGPRAVKKKIRAKSPMSEQLASLKLKEGKNDVTFTFSTAMLGKQQVDARIFLWKWNTRIVISDVDGTITKSDVLGQFMPLMGMDWSQTGVTHLFSAIKENGYQLLFLSARSISQAYHTRQFLFNLKQEGKELPEGPVLISPDGLFPSLYREVIRRAPHEFKISCLEDIKVLFPSDHNPFYAGFGNRDTDEISYLRVGIPIGKIFIINPKGQIAVNRRVDTKSYSSLHDLVHGMFPPAPATEQEDYNSWNFWRLPPPDVI